MFGGLKCDRRIVRHPPANRFAHHANRQGAAPQFHMDWSYGNLFRGLIRVTAACTRRLPPVSIAQCYKSLIGAVFAVSKVGDFTNSPLRVGQINLAFG